MNKKLIGVIGVIFAVLGFLGAIQQYTKSLGVIIASAVFVIIGLILLTIGFSD